MSSAELDDNFTLFLAARAEDTMAFKRLYQQYWKKLYISACKRVDAADAQDMVQEVMLTLWQRKDKINIQNSDDLGRYLYTALRYRIISHYAFSNHTVQIPEWFDQPTQAGFETAMDLDKVKDLIDSEVHRMPARMQHIYQLSRQQGLSVTDIARQLNLSEQTVRNQLSLAMKKLRLLLRNHYQGDLIICTLLLMNVFDVSRLS
ncbi:sigma-70 family RNA polymerase sigma factor [Chitinophaga japonensis]|uniref:RNA polymerase sigma-70 factor (ECF subfamily) n=1 Tax=Chitinophaga japonensis TaxID=104662 RepID=A0A562TCP2_CHIJA|nr:sigma-70 family RNA polymerase sigma factor [Chitinophaga japonensis]TWI91272.1 RNA polymerase sigma-70 factor (ECF subfamily) [Chitinophaga japonensis]